MVDRKTTPEPCAFPLQFFKNVQSKLNTEIARAVNVDFVPRVPIETRRLLKLLGHHDPFAVMPIDIAGVLKLHELRKESPIRKEFHVITESQAMRISFWQGLDEVERCCIVTLRTGKRVDRTSVV